MELRAPQTYLGKKIGVFTCPIIKLLLYPLDEIKKIRLKKVNPQNQKTLLLFYDLEVCSITYDFIWALILAEHQRKTAGCESLSVVIVPGSFQGIRAEMPEYESVINTEFRKWRIHHLLLPLSNLLPSCKSIVLCESRRQASEIYNNVPKQNIFPFGYSPTLPICHMVHNAIKLGKKGVDLRYLQAPPAALEYIQRWIKDNSPEKKIITITLREYDFAPERNSSLETWVKFAKQIDPAKYHVVFVRDTEKAMSSVPNVLQGFSIFDAACWVPSVRLALYELSYLNLSVNTGPMATCWMSENTRYITFKMTGDGTPYVLPRTMEAYGFQQDKSLPFASPFQKWVWKKDDLEVILDEFEQMVQKIDE